MMAQTDALRARKDGERSAGINGGRGMASDPGTVGIEAWEFRCWKSGSRRREGLSRPQGSQRVARHSHLFLSWTQGLHPSEPHPDLAQPRESLRVVSTVHGNTWMLAICAPCLGHDAGLGVPSRKGAGILSTVTLGCDPARDRSNGCDLPLSQNCTTRAVDHQRKGDLTAALPWETSFPAWPPVTPQCPRIDGGENPRQDRVAGLTTRRPVLGPEGGQP